jgi:hypothetical protein
MVKGELSRPSFSRPTAQIVNRLTQLRRGKGPIGVARVPGEALENHFLLRAGASRSGSGGLAWVGGESGSLLLSQLHRCNEHGGIHRRDGGGVGKR